MIDVSVHLSRWPFRRLPLDETEWLVERLHAVGMRQAWAGSFDAILHRDMAAVNARLYEMCRGADAGGMLVPFGAVNPTLPDWEEDLRRCRDIFHMPGVRLYPNYHGYKLDEPPFTRLLAIASEAGLLVQVAVSMEDERTQHPLVRVPPVDLTPLPAVLKNVPGARVMLLNAIRAPRSAALTALASVEQVSFDIAALENVGGVAGVLEQVPAERVVLGSHAPFFYPEAAVLKLRESPLEADVVRKISFENAARLLGRQ